MLTGRDITISTAPNRFSTRWEAETLPWSALAARLMTPAIGSETVAEFRALPRAGQDRLKDVGGFVGGALRGGRRRADCVQMRDAVTLDLDRVPAGGAGDVLRRAEGLGCAFALYSTRRHTAERPRLRVVIPLDEPCAPGEYEPIARMAAKGIGIELCDPTTFEAARLMYWPSRSVDGEFFGRVHEGPLLCRDDVLDLYADWRDAKEWPKAEGEKAHPTPIPPIALPRIPPSSIVASQRRDDVRGVSNCTNTAKATDPAEKPGLVGEFCRTYDVYRAVAELLPGVYLPTGRPGRYTYAAGSTEGGAVVYGGGRFLYSFHATDPCSRRLVNSYDLVRLHRFGSLDAGAPEGVRTGRLPSSAEMRRYARSLLADWKPDPRQIRGAAANAGLQPAPMGGAGDWAALLAAREGNGLPLNTVDNVVTILEHDPALAGAVEYDEFSARAYVTGSLPWKPYPGWRRVWGEADDSQLVRYLEKAYGIAGDQKIRHGLAACLDSHAVNFVARYLDGVAWDGVPRLDTLFVDYLGVADTPYARAVTRQAFTAAAARAYAPGTQYDSVPILCGRQGIGKSTVLRVMGGEWYCDSVCSFSGRDASELLQGMWVIELGELAALARAEIDEVKHFITKRDDQFRAPYARRTCVFPRRCVFFGTTNRQRHLTDTTGNRRFLPLDCDAARRVKSPWKDLPGERNQLWAEAAWRWKRGAEPLCLPPGLECEAEERRLGHMAADPRSALLAEFLQRRLPPGWMNRSVEERLRYWDTPPDPGTSALWTPRRTVSRREAWVECFRRDPADLDARGAAEIDGLMAAIPGWSRHPSNFRNGPYGTERGYVRDEDRQSYI